MSTNRTERTSVVPRQSVSSDIRVHGARTHNLKDVSLSFPRDTMVIFTGVSGSGKSSLAFDTIYAEAQRRYMESIAPHARRLIEQASVPEVDNIDGLPPAVALQQSRAGAQERSTVGSLTRISVTLRLLFSRAGINRLASRFWLQRHFPQIILREPVRFARAWAGFMKLNQRRWYPINH